MINKKNSGGSLANLGEIGFIKYLQKVIKTDKSVIKGIGDDTAVLPYTQHSYLLMTADMLLEDVHFLRSDSPRLIGRKALACNISDIAAMGGLPRHATISVGMPQDIKLAYVKEIIRGISDFARRYNINIIGGDTNHSRKIIIDIALLGVVEKDNLVLRSGARPGDFLFVTGPLGGSLASGRHLSFTPRLYEARYLVKAYKPRAMIDVSDGLVLDLSRIAQASGVGALLYEGLIPKRKNVTLENALYDGEDYELLFALSPYQARRLERKASRKIPAHKIGMITDTKNTIKLLVRDGAQKKLNIKGYMHF